MSISTAPSRGPARPENPAEALVLRPSTPADEEFRREVYCADLLQTFLAAGQPQARAQALVAMQYHGFSAHLATDGFEHTTVLDGEQPVALLVTHPRVDELRVVWVAVAPSRRGQRLGEAVLAPVVARAHAAGLPVTLHVDPTNAPARALYARLGFEPATGSESAVDLFLRTSGSL